MLAGVSVKPMYWAGMAGCRVGLVNLAGVAGSRACELGRGGRV